MDDIKAHIAGPDLAENGVQICTIIVEQPAGLMNNGGDLFNPAFKHPQRRGIGEHDTRGLWPYRLLQRGKIHITLCVRRNLMYLVTAHGGGSRVSAVCGIRHQDFRALRIPLCIMPGTNHGHTGKFTLRTRGRCQRHRRHPGHILEHLLQLVHTGKEPLPH